MKSRSDTFLYFTLAGLVVCALGLRWMAYVTKPPPEPLPPEKIYNTQFGQIHGKLNDESVRSILLTNADSRTSSNFPSVLRP